MRRRRRLPRGGDVRAIYAEHLRAKYADRPVFWGHFEPLVEALERGVPVVVRWWEIAAFAAVDRGRSSLFVRLESDGRLAYVEPIRDGLNITGWRSIA